MGCPIIASDLPSIREVLTDGESAVLVPAGDSQALADAMSTLASDATLSEKLGQAALALSPQYTWERRAERLEEGRAAAGVRERSSPPPPRGGGGRACAGG